MAEIVGAVETKHRGHIDNLSVEVFLRCIQLFMIVFLQRPDKYRRLLARLCLVSRSWAAAVIGDGFLWSHIYVDECMAHSTIKMYLERSKGMKLSLFMHLGPTSHYTGTEWWDASDMRQLLPSGFLWRWESTIEILRPTFGRCQRLLLRADDEPSSYILMSWLQDATFPCLTAAHFFLTPYSLQHQRTEPVHADQLGAWQLPTFGHRGVPELRFVMWHCAFAPWKQTCVYDHLTFLRLNNLTGEMAPTARELFTAIGAASRLMYLSLVNVLLDEDDLRNVDIEPISLPKLSHLYFSCTSELSICLLSFFRTPALRKLSLQFQDETLLPEFVQHCWTMLQNVESLFLHVCSIGVEDLALLLESVPNVQYFDTRGSTAHLSLSFYAVICNYQDIVHAPHLIAAYFDEFVHQRVMRSMLTLARSTRFGDPVFAIAAASVPPIYMELPVPTYHWLDNTGRLNKRPITWLDNKFLDGW